MLETLLQALPAARGQRAQLLHNSAVARSLARERGETWAGLAAEEISRPPLPVFMDLEITTDCQLRCPHCARTFQQVPSQHLGLTELARILERMTSALQVTLVGLGEPLLHPRLGAVLEALNARRLRAALVTNGLALSASKGRELLDSGLDSLTFSLDSASPEVLAAVRPDTDLDTVVGNIAAFMRVRAAAAARLPVSIFCALQPATVAGLGDLAALAARLGIPSIVVSDLNFAHNQPRSLTAASGRAGLIEELWEQMRLAASHGVVLLRPAILDEVVPELDWPHALLRDPAELLAGGSRRRNCLAPWRTLVVRVDGAVDFCNCSPGQGPGGSLVRDSLAGMWHHADFQRFRERLHHGPVPAACTVCPRL